MASKKQTTINSDDFVREGRNRMTNNMNSANGYLSVDGFPQRNFVKMPPKKNTKKNKNDDWDDDAAEKKLAALQVTEEKDKWDDEEEDEAPPRPAPKGKSAFAFAMMDDDSDAGSDVAKSDSEPEPEPEVVVKKEEKPKKQQEKKAAEPKKEDGKKKGKKGKKGKQAEEDDDLDAILADLEKPTEKGEPKKVKEETPTPAEPTGEAAPTEEKADEPAEADDAKKKKKKKKKDKKKGGDDEEEAADEPAADEASKEKKEGDEEGEEGEEGGEGEGKDKKKKKKKDKKKDKKEDEKPKKKSHVSMIKELLRAKQEAEEAEAQRIREEEERLERLEKEREEAAKKAAEKKEQEKERKKALIAKQKAEGTYMTAKEKEKRRIAEAKLAALGLPLPQAGQAAAAPAGEKKPIIYMDKRAKAKAERREQKKREEQAGSAEGSGAPTPAPSTPVPSKDVSPVVESASAAQEEPLDDWEMADEIPVPVAAPAEAAPVAIKTSSPAPVKKTQSAQSKDEEEDEEESSEEESSEESSSEEDSSDEESEDEGPKGKLSKEEVAEMVKQRLKKRREAAEANRSTDILRAPVICVMGHVDTGKTKMLDTIRRTNVQDGEAGGITQQIGATQVPAEAIKERCKQVRDFVAEAMKIPGFLVIDTPGHESFSNLRSRGSSLCDFAILVVDIMHGLEPQTIESLKMLLKRQTPFVVALNKIDRLYGYETNPRKDVYQHLKSQPTHTQLEFKERYEKVVTEFAEQGLNVCLSNQNKNREEYIAMVPTSAFHGDGIGNLMAYIVNTTQTHYAQKLSFSEELDASVMEVKAIAGLGTTIDVILVNGTLRVGDILVLTGSDGAITAQIRDLLMPPALREIRVKTEFDHYKMIKGAQGVKILAKGLEKAIAGLPVYVAHKHDEVEVLMEEADAQLSRALTSIKRKPEGVYVQASTLGSLEALLEFLKSQKIPYSNVNIGPVHKKDVQKAAAMKEHKAEYACILAFDVKVEREAQIFADHEGVRIFQADIIYHLEDSFLKYREDLRLKARKDNEHKAIFPCKLRILPHCIFNARNPIVIGVSVEAGQLKRGTPICVPSKEGIFLGTISSLERNNEEVPLAKKGDEVCIKIENTTGEAPKLYGRHFTHEDSLISRITRESIDVCKTHFRDDLSREDWQLVVQLKRLLDIM